MARKTRKPKQTTTNTEDGLLHPTDVEHYFDTFCPGNDDPAEVDSQFLPEIRGGTYEFEVSLE